MDRKMAQFSPTPKTGTKIIVGHCRIGSAVNVLNVVTLLYATYPELAVYFAMLQIVCYNWPS